MFFLKYMHFLTQQKEDKTKLKYVKHFGKAPRKRINAYCIAMSFIVFAEIFSSKTSFLH